MRTRSLSSEELEILKDETPWYPVQYRRGAKSTEAALRMGLITEEDIVD
jgi:hypothetical protein